MSLSSRQRIAPRLARDFTVVATDLRGYGDSSKPRGTPDHSNYSFRRMAQDQVEVMRSLGFEQFFVAGHDRGARTAFRMALDHPDRVLKAAFLDILPTHLGKGGFTEEEIREYVRVCTPENIHGVCEDYRAAGGIDLAMDSADFEAARKIACPALVLWGELSHTGKHYRPQEVWPRYCSNIVRMQALPCGHYPSEQAPEDTYRGLQRFFIGSVPR